VGVPPVVTSAASKVAATVRGAAQGASDAFEGEAEAIEDTLDVLGPYGETGISSDKRHFLVVRGVPWRSRPAADLVFQGGGSNPSEFYRVLSRVAARGYFSRVFLTDEYIVRLTRPVVSIDLHRDDARHVTACFADASMSVSPRNNIFLDRPFMPTEVTPFELRRFGFRMRTVRYPYLYGRVDDDHMDRIDFDIALAADALVKLSSLGFMPSASVTLAGIERRARAGDVVRFSVGGTTLFGYTSKVTFIVQANPASGAVRQMTTLQLEWVTPSLEDLEAPLASLRNRVAVLGAPPFDPNSMDAGPPVARGAEVATQKGKTSTVYRYDLKDSKQPAADEPLDGDPMSAGGEDAP